MLIILFIHNDVYISWNYGVNKLRAWMYYIGIKKKDVTIHTCTIILNIVL
jgi:hypothetical protein